MIRFFLRSMIQRATVTEASIGTDSSIAIDRHLLNAAGLIPYEKVEIQNVATGVRFETHVVEGEAGKGGIAISGAGTHVAKAGDLISIAAYCLLHDGQTLDHRPKLVVVDESNQLLALDEAKTSEA